MDEVKSPYLRSALEWFNATGPHTLERLQSLVRHYVELYGSNSMDTYMDEAKEYYEKHKSEWFA